MKTTTRRSHATLSHWLLDHPAPVRVSELAGWERDVRARFDPTQVPSLLGLLVGGDDEVTYQAMAALRVFGVVLWEADRDTRTWDVQLPDGSAFRLSPRT